MKNATVFFQQIRTNLSITWTVLTSDEFPHALITNCFILVPVNINVFVHYLVGACVTWFQALLTSCDRCISATVQYNHFEHILNTLMKKVQLQSDTVWHLNCCQSYVLMVA